MVQAVPGKYRSGDVGASITVPTHSTAAVDLEKVWLRRLDFAGGPAVIEFEGAAQREYVLQAQADSSQGWWNVSTNRTDAVGRGTLRDESAPEAAVRFYRVVRFP